LRQKQLQVKPQRKRAAANLLWKNRLRAAEQWLKVGQAWLSVFAPTLRSARIVADIEQSTLELSAGLCFAVGIVEPVPFGLGFTV
jgi:hypothetical protein